MTTHRKISNSEVSTWLTCRRQYYYRFDLNVQPFKFGSALSRGILFHSAMEAFNKVYIDKKSFELAFNAGSTRIGQELNNTQEYNYEDVLDCKRIFNNYMNVLRARIGEWRILETEQKYELPINEQFSMPMRLDVLIEEVATGATCLVDYKTCYNFWTENQITLSPQAAKYVGALRANGKQVDKLILEQVRYRTIKSPSSDQLFRRTFITPSNAKIRNVFRDHIVASNSISQYRDLSAETRESIATRTLNPMICNGCTVKDLCMAELDGGDIRYLLQNDYKQNTYDYNQTQEIVEDL